jgi:DNA polymerase-4
MVARRMRVDGYLGRVVAIKIRDSRFHTTIRQRALPEIMNNEEQIYRTATALFDENWDGRALRLIGVSVSGLVQADGGVQECLFASDEHRRRMIAAVDSLRDRFGDSAIVRAGVLK